MNSSRLPVRTLLWVGLFSVAFAFVEASVVVYLRAIYYPEGFVFPLEPIPSHHLVIEIAREAATILMLVAVGVLAGRRAWERFGYFLVAFGMWDICFYAWLKVTLDWPASVFEWDVLFLIPVPWIGPVIAPVLISLLMVGCGATAVARIGMGERFHPTLISWLLASSATIVILYSFVSDFPATLGGAMPQPYRYELLLAGLFLYLASFVLACWKQSVVRST